MFVIIVKNQVKTEHFSSFKYFIGKAILNKESFNSKNCHLTGNYLEGDEMNTLLISKRQLKKIFLSILRGFCLVSVFAGLFPASIYGQKNRELVREGAQARIALVIGNGAYQYTTALANPPNDAADMAKTLKELGFEVLSGIDQNKKQMETLIRQFGDKLARQGKVGLFYYAGHGVQVNGQNYLIPVDAEIPEEDEVPYASVSLNFMIGKMAAANNDFNIVILDACRNNPFSRSWRGFRDSNNNDGLTEVRPPTGTKILYAARPGGVASDGTGRNGLFTEALLKHIKRPNLEYNQLIRDVSIDVYTRSGKKQVPYVEGTQLNDFYFVVPEPVSGGTSQPPKSIPSPETKAKTPEVKAKTPEVKPKTVNPPPLGNVKSRVQIEREFWARIKNSTDPEDFRSYLKEYPNGAYAAFARNNLRKLSAKNVSAQKPNLPAEQSDKVKLDNQNSSITPSNADLTNNKPDASAVPVPLSTKKSAESLTQSGEKHLEQAEYDLAINDFTESLSINPKYTKAIIYKARALRLKGESQKALDEINELLKNEPSNSEAYVEKGFIYAGMTALKDYLKLSTQAFDAAILHSPTMVSAYLGRKDTYLLRGKTDKAMDDLDKVVSLEPKNERNYLLRGIIYSNEAQSINPSDQGTPVPSTSVATGTGAAGAALIGMLVDSQMRKNRFAKAIENFTEAIRLNPQTSEAYAARGNVYYFKKDYELAIKDYSEVIRINPLVPDFYLVRGVIYVIQKNYESALKDYNEAIRLKPDHETAYFLRGEMHFTRKDYQLAVDDYSEAIRLNSNNFLTYQRRWIAYKKLGQKDLAEADRKKSQAILKQR
jgi:tetratricopeptide (TPR) repeat protein